MAVPKLSHAVSLMLMATLATGCTSLGGSGPTTRAINAAPKHDDQIRIVPLSAEVVRTVQQAGLQTGLAEALGDAPRIGTLVGSGDVLDISIWEAPPAALFSNGPSTIAIGAAPMTGKTSDIPSQMVSDEGNVTVPYVGRIHAAGRSTDSIAAEIVRRLQGKAHQPQAIVRISQNQTSNVTVVGEVNNSRRVPLTSKGERLLDALAAASGSRHPVDKVTVQVTRGGTVVSQPLGAVIRDPSSNIRLAADDVVTVIFQPYSFQALGAVNRPSEVEFESTGITLARALGRVGGLQDSRADVKGVFIFRLEDPAALPPAVREGARLTPDGKVPVIYTVDLKDPASFFFAQSFPIRDKDVLYVSNAPLVDLQKFVGMTSQIAFSVVGIANAVP